MFACTKAKVGNSLGKLLHRSLVQFEPDDTQDVFVSGKPAHMNGRPFHGVEGRPDCHFCLISFSWPRISCSWSAISFTIGFRALGPLALPSRFFSFLNCVRARSSFALWSKYSLRPFPP